MQQSRLSARPRQRRSGAEGVKREMPQEDLAKAVGITVRTLCQLETRNGNPTGATSAASPLGVSISEFTGRGATVIHPRAATTSTSVDRKKVGVTVGSPRSHSRAKNQTGVEPSP
jgi:hypothetical protein